ncbi:hypothetical protein ACVW1B_005796 [Bradyrhizobium sp. USDA 4502]
MPILISGQTVPGSLFAEVLECHQLGGSAY